MASLTDTLNTVGISAFGLSMPVLASKWTTGTPTITKDDNNLSLSIAANSWLVPATGTLRRIEGGDVRVTLIRANGSIQSGPGMLLTLFPQIYLRLARLYAQELETANA